MKKLLSYVLLSVVSFSCVLAENQDKAKYIIYGLVRDALTGQVQKHARVTLMDKDSTVLDTVSVFYSKYSSVWAGGGSSITEEVDIWHFKLTDRTLRSSYILRFESEGHKPKYITYHFKPRKKNVYRLDDVKLMRKPPERQLGEAVVKATHVKFYNKGDTLVFNADAFQLAEGSMLDALIRQLPGVELKDNGQIYVNGRYVESLLLNGEEFFGKDGSIMLENLPAYMVKDVRTYEKKEWHEVNRLYVMDVKLKRQYSVGWIANAEAGGGSDSRYLGRLFALRFTPQSRLSVFGNINNINENRKPGQNGDWTPANMPEGRHTLKQVGLDYLVNEKNGRYKLQGSAAFARRDGDNYSHSSSTRFLESGNSYRYTQQRTQSQRTDVSTAHTFAFDKVDVYHYSLSPRFSYSRWKNNGLSLSSMLDAEYDWTSAAEALDSIFSPTVNPVLKQHIANRYRGEDMTKGHNLSTGLHTSGTWQMQGYEHFLRVSTGVNYTDYAYRTFENDLYEYPAQGAVYDDPRNRYDHYKLQEINYNYNLFYHMMWEPLGMEWHVEASPYVDAKYYFTDLRDRLYNLNDLEEWENDSPLGWLPSNLTYLQGVMDNTNSYVNQRRDYSHYVGLNLYYWHRYAEGKGRVQFSANLPVALRHERQEYVRDQIDTLFHRNTAGFNPDVYVTNSFNNPETGKYHAVTLSYIGKYTAPNMVTLLNTRSDNNPLVVTLGNPDLKSSYRHTAALQYTMNNRKRERSLFFNVSYVTTRRQVASGFVYDPATGVYTYKPENINGNYNTSSRLTFSTPFDQARKLKFETTTAWQYYHSVDLMGTAQAGGEALMRSTRSTVHTHLLTEQIKLDYALSKATLGVKGNVTWQNATSARESFNEISAFDYQYGLTARITLPWDMRLSTDLTVYSRRGYATSGMNTDDVVWNARLTKNFMQGNLQVMVDGFDILHQLSGTSFSINGQGQTETFRSVLPRYVMAHIIYRLNIKPKKRPGDA